MRISDWSSDVCSSDLHVSVWSLVDFHLVYTFRVSDDTVRCISLSPDERQIAFGCRDNLIRIYDTTELSLLAELNGHTMSVFSLQYGPDGKHLLSGARDAQLKIWDTASFTEVGSIPAHMYEFGRASCRERVCQYV